MKKRIIAAAALMCLMCGCEETKEPSPVIINATEQVTEATDVVSEETQRTIEDIAETTAEDTSAATEIASETAAEEAAAEITEQSESVFMAEEAVINELFEKNIDCMINIFSLSSLPYSDVPVLGDNIFKVEDSRFPDYASFESYIREIYCTAEADRLLYNFPYENGSKYCDIDGALCININLDGSKGYYVDWSDHTLQILSADDSVCEFTVTGYIEEPADVPVKEEYTVSGKALYENGRWVLEKMLY